MHAFAMFGTEVNLNIPVPKLITALFFFFFFSQSASFPSGIKLIRRAEILKFR